MFEQSLNSFRIITPLQIIAFLIPFILAIVIDLTSHKKGQTITMKDATMWSLIWIACAALFAGFVWWSRGEEAVKLYTAGYILEKALAVDNLFAFFLIFKAFGLVRPENQHYQHRILYWGILGAIVFRILFLGAGALIVNLSPFVLVIFALIVLWTVAKMWFSSHADVEVDYANHWSVRIVRRFTRVNPSIASGKFFDHGATPLFLCLICIEACDIIFAFDSMPVIVAVVQDPYLMITSTLWAAAGLRSLYFLLVAAQNKFWALEKAVMLLLVLVAGKLIAAATDHHLPTAISLSLIAFILIGGIVLSLSVKAPGSNADPETKP